MEEKFLGFGQLTRPDVGLLADNSQNLAEIYKSDQPTALRNIQLNQEILDIIHDVSETVSREDLRAISDLSNLLLTTLHLQKETFSRINENITNDEVYASGINRIGVSEGDPSLSGDQIRSENVIILNGAIQCDSAEYRENVISSSDLFSSEKINSQISISKSSFFNSAKNEAGYFESVYFPGSVRVRKKSHISSIDVNPLNFVPAPPVIEQPTKVLKINIKNGSNSASQYKFLAVENSPLKLPCRLKTGSIDFKFETGGGPYFYGLQIQPQNSKEGEEPKFLSVSQEAQIPNSDGSFNSTHTVNIDIKGTGYENTEDLYLYLYLNPEKVEEITFTGIQLEEFFDGKDIGLIGFSNLKKLRFVSKEGKTARLKTLPIQLKNLKDTFEELDISRTTPMWTGGKMGYFDYRSTSTVSDFSSVPSYTMVSYLTIPKKGAILNEEGNGYNDPNDHLFQKYIESGVATGTDIPVSGDSNYRDPSSDFRQFTAFKKLDLGVGRVKGKNVRLDDVFPNLNYLKWVGNDKTGNFHIYGPPPKINNHGNIIDLYDISYQRIGNTYSIDDIGTSTDVDDDGHISKYKIKKFKILGTYPYRSNIRGFIGGRVGGENTSTSENDSKWENWFENTEEIHVRYSNRNNLFINLQPGGGRYWEKLRNLNSNHFVGTYFKDPINYNGGISNGSDPMMCPKLSDVRMVEWKNHNSTGTLPRLGDHIISNECNPITLHVSALTGIGLFTENNFKYLFPQNFAANTNTEYRLENFVADGYFPSSPVRIRENTFEKCEKLKTLRFEYNRFTGIFPIISSGSPENEDREIELINIFEADFHDLSRLSIDSNGLDVVKNLINLIASYQNKHSGGCKLPSFKGLEGAKIKNVRINNSLPSQYPTGWSATTVGVGQYVSNEDPSNTIQSCVYNAVLNANDSIYYISNTSSLNLRLYALVNDKIYFGGEEVATVISVGSSRIYIDGKINDLSDGDSNLSFEFKRNTVDISDWFSTGSFQSLNSFQMSNCRLSGVLDVRTNLNSISKGYRGRGLTVSNNAISDISDETFDRIFTGTNRDIVLNFSKNNFTGEKIRKFVGNLLNVYDQGIYTKVTVNLSECKFNSSGPYEQHSQTEIFPITPGEISQTTISLSRTEKIKVYETVIEYDSNGNAISPPTRVQVGTKFITVPGREFTGYGPGSSVAPNGDGYYKQKVTNLQGSIETPEEIRYRAISNTYFKINLGFDYVPPNISPQEISFSYGEFAGSGNDGRLATIREALGDDSFQLEDLAD